jgi:hypothetical protein
MVKITRNADAIVRNVKITGNRSTNPPFFITRSQPTSLPAISTGLIIYLPFDSSYTDLVGTTSFSQTGSISYVTGLFSQAVSMTNGSWPSAPTNYVSSSYALPSTFTISLWFQTPSLTTNSAIIYTNLNPAYVYGGISIYFAGANLYCAYSSVVNNGSATAISVNTWYHILITYNTGSTTLYVNGTQRGSTISGTNSKNGLTIGGGADSGGSYPFSGLVDDLRVYNRVLTSGEISSIYAKTG